jgi:hypothetical protein
VKREIAPYKLLGCTVRRIDHNTGDTMIHPFPKIVIVTPMKAETVGLFASVRGFASIENPAALEVLVQSLQDGRYYLQRHADVRVEGEAWSAYCQFGNLDAPGNEYNIVAVYGSPLELKSYDHIPEGLIVSNIVNVRRPV